MAHCAVTAAQPTKGRLRRLGMRGPRRQVQFVQMLQISAGAAATEEGGARQVVASQLQADI